MNLIRISDGELLDKYSILDIKLKNIKDEVKKLNVKKEFDYLHSKILRFKMNKKYTKLLNKLVKVNKKLWKIEDDIREKERLKKFDEGFIHLARQVYLTNDLRFSIKNQINSLSRNSFKEEKSYKKY